MTDTKTDTKTTQQYLDYKTINVKLEMYCIFNTTYNPFKELDKQVKEYLEKKYVLIGGITVVPMSTEKTDSFEESYVVKKYVTHNYITQTVALPCS